MHPTKEYTGIDHQINKQRKVTIRHTEDANMSNYYLVFKVFTFRTLICSLNKYKRSTTAGSYDFKPVHMTRKKTFQRIHQFVKDAQQHYHNPTANNTKGQSVLYY